MRSITFAILLAACGGSSSQPEHPSTPKTFKDMNLDERTEFMKTVVLPKTKELFVAFDPKFDKMNCETCHGDGAKDGTWKMPNPKIKPLPATEEAFMAWIQKEPDEAKWTQFMAEKLEPEMGKLLQLSVFDPKTKTGEFSCHNCHTSEGGEPAKAP